MPVLHFFVQGSSHTVFGGIKHTKHVLYNILTAMFSAHCPLDLSHILDVVFKVKPRKTVVKDVAKKVGAWKNFFFLSYPNWAKVEIRQL